MENYLKLPEAALRLGVSERTMRRYVRAGTLPSIFVGGAYRVAAEDIDAYIENARTAPKVRASRALASTTA
jgi:excisionase family DNA binding protein